jgi:hypothetical protein
MQDTASRLARRLYTRRLPFVNWVLPPRDVVIKQVEPQWVASIRDAVSTPADQGRLWDELDAYLGQQSQDGRAMPDQSPVPRRKGVMDETPKARTFHRVQHTVLAGLARIFHEIMTKSNPNP